MEELQASEFTRWAHVKRPIGRAARSGLVPLELEQLLFTRNYHHCIIIKTYHYELVLIYGSSLFTIGDRAIAFNQNRVWWPHLVQCSLR